MDTAYVEKLKEKLAGLHEQMEQLKAHLNATGGAIQFCQMLLDEELAKESHHETSE